MLLILSLKEPVINLYQELVYIRGRALVQSTFNSGVHYLRCFRMRCRVLTLVNDEINAQSSVAREPAGPQCRNTIWYFHEREECRGLR